MRRRRMSASFLSFERADGLSDDNLQVVVNAAFVSVGRNLQPIFRRSRRLALLLCLLVQDAERRKVVLNFLEGAQGRLAVIRGGRVVIRPRRLAKWLYAGPRQTTFRQAPAPPPKEHSAR